LLDAQNFTNYSTASTSSTLCNNEVNTIVIDAQGNKWFGTAGGVSKFDGTNWTTYNTTNGLTDNNSIVVTIDSDGNKWIGTQIGGASKFDGTNWINYSQINGLINNQVRTIAIDLQGNKWFGTGAGLSKLTELSTIVNSSDVAKELLLYPNPAKAIVNFESPCENEVIRLFDISGKCILTQRTGSSSNTLNVAHITKGLYIVKYFSGNKYITKKLILE
jgi:streptogramin lyase